MSVAEGAAILVSDHALWRAAERLGRSVGADEIEREIRAAFAAGRVATDKRVTGLPFPSVAPRRLYLWSDEGVVFAVTAEREQFCVRTVMTP